MLCWQKLIGFAVVGLVLVLSPSVSGQSSGSVVGCSGNFTMVGNKCLLVVKNLLNWYQADRNCRSLGANLMSLESPSELQQLNNWFEMNQPYVLDYWTSGNSLGQDNVFYWQNTGLKAEYLPWATSSTGLATGDCLTLYGNFTRTSINGPIAGYALVPEMCVFINPSICELPANLPQQTSTRICLSPDAFEMAQVLVN